MTVPLWKKLASTVVVFDEEPAEPMRPQASNLLPVSSRPTVAAPPPMGVDPALFETLMTAALARKTVFSGLVDSARRLESVIPDEMQRIKAAAAMTQQSITPAAVQTAVAGHVQDLQVERGKFTRDLAAVQATKVNAPTQQAATLDAQVGREQAEMARLTQSIEAAQTQAAQLRATAAAANSEITATTAMFDAAISQVEQRLTALSDNITSALSK